MSVEVKRRRMATTDREAMTPAIAELIYDTDLDKVFMGDGSTAGGLEQAFVPDDLVAINTVQFAENDCGSKTTDYTIDWDANGQKQKVTLTANTITLTLDNPTGAGNFTLNFVNAGLATLTWGATTGSVYWAGGTEPTWTSAGTDIVSFYYDGTDFYGAASLDFS